MFSAVVGTHATREPAEVHADLLREHDVQVLMTLSLDGQAWVVVVPVAQYPRAAKLMGELPESEPPE